MISQPMTRSGSTLHTPASHHVRCRQPLGLAKSVRASSDSEPKCRGGWPGRVSNPGSLAGCLPLEPLISRPEARKLVMVCTFTPVALVGTGVSFALESARSRARIGLK